MNKASEWWIFPRPFNNLITQVYPVKQEGYTYPDQLHVIEKSAYDKLRADAEALVLALEHIAEMEPRPQCAYCANIAREALGKIK